MSLDFFFKENKKIKQKQLFRNLRNIDFTSTPYILIEGKRYIDFSSNDYLGYKNNKELKEAAINAVSDYGTGSSASRLISGNMELYKKLEHKLSLFLNTEDALVFNSGYVLNYSLLSCIAEQNDLLIVDRLCHASIIDGSKSSKAKLMVYSHLNYEHLEHILKKSRHKYGKVFVITESIFSMDGDQTDIKEVYYICSKYKSFLILDDAHALGVLGKKGKGLLEQSNLMGKTDIIIGTFSKALGSLGGFMGCSKEIKDFVLNRARGLIYSTALPPSVLAVNLKSVKLVQKDHKLRKRIDKTSEYVRKKIMEAGFDLKQNGSHIIPIIIGDEKKTMELSKKLFEKRIFVPSIRYPTVKKKTARLRISITAMHSKNEIDALVNHLTELRES